MTDAASDRAAPAGKPPPPAADDNNNNNRRSNNIDTAEDDRNPSPSSPDVLSVTSVNSTDSTPVANGGAKGGTCTSSADRNGCSKSSTSGPDPPGSRAADYLAEMQAKKAWVTDRNDSSKSASIGQVGEDASMEQQGQGRANIGGGTNISPSAVGKLADDVEAKRGAVDALKEVLEALKADEEVASKDWDQSKKDQVEKEYLETEAGKRLASLRVLSEKLPNDPRVQNTRFQKKLAKEEAKLKVHIQTANEELNRIRAEIMMTEEDLKAAEDDVEAAKEIQDELVERLLSGSSSDDESSDDEAEYVEEEEEVAAAGRDEEPVADGVGSGGGFKRDGGGGFKRDGDNGPYEELGYRSGTDEAKVVQKIHRASIAIGEATGLAKRTDKSVADIVKDAPAKSDQKEAIWNKVASLTRFPYGQILNDFMVKTTERTLGYKLDSLRDAVRVKFLCHLRERCEESARSLMLSSDRMASVTICSYKYKGTEHHLRATRATLEYLCIDYFKRVKLDVQDIGSSALGMDSGLAVPVVSCQRHSIDHAVMINSMAGVLLGALTDKSIRSRGHPIDITEFFRGLPDCHVTNLEAIVDFRRKGGKRSAQGEGSPDSARTDAAVRRDPNDSIIERTYAASVGSEEEFLLPGVDLTVTQSDLRALQKILLDISGGRIKSYDDLVLLRAKSEIPKNRRHEMISDSDIVSMLKKLAKMKFEKSAQYILVMTHNNLNAFQFPVSAVKAFYGRGTEMRTNFRAWFKAMFFGGSEAIVGGRPEQIPRKFEGSSTLMDKY